MWRYRKPIEYVSLTAKQRFRYRGRTLQAGDTFEAHPMDLKALSALGVADVAPKEPAPPLPAEEYRIPPQDVAIPKAWKGGKGRYKRRDMRAEG